MFIVWGKKVVHRKIGFVADFCPICREPKAFLLNRIGVASHVYYISFGEGQLAGYERVCQGCIVRLKAEPSRYRATPSKFAGLEALIQTTFPDLRNAYAERLRIEEKLKNTPALLSSDERQAMIKQPFTLLSPLVEARYARTHIDMEAGLALLGTGLALCIAPAVIERVAPDYMGQALLAITLVGGVVVLWQFATAGRRFVKRKIAPVLIKSLHSLDPSEAEIKNILAELKRFRQKLGIKLKPVDVLQITRSV